MLERVTLNSGEVVFAHPASRCANDPSCSIHKPSNHPMRDWPQHWRDDRGLMERVCPHGVGHPDPDDLAFRRRRYGMQAAVHAGIHGCDGCCALEENT